MIYLFYGHNCVWNISRKLTWDDYGLNRLDLITWALFLWMYIQPLNNNKRAELSRATPDFSSSISYDFPKRYMVISHLGFCVTCQNTTLFLLHINWPVQCTLLQAVPNFTCSKIQSWTGYSIFALCWLVSCIFFFKYDSHIWPQPNMGTPPYGRPEPGKLSEKYRVLHFLLVIVLKEWTLSV